MAKVGAMPRFVVFAMYKFVTVPEPTVLRDRVQSFCEAQEIKGTLLIGSEGINGTVAGTRGAMDALLRELHSHPFLADLQPKESHCDDMPFCRTKVKVKKEIVTIGDNEIAPSKRVGTYVPPGAWNELLEDPEVVLIDTRNRYETRIGTFEGAIDPDITAFTEFPQWVRDNLDPQKHKKVAMFCTGGIRCEKATSLLMREGFSEVFHLQGGILKYMQDVPKNQSKWQGDCFVFDRRVALNHDLAPSDYVLCFGCQEPLSPQDVQSPQYEAGVCCPRCFDKTSAPLLASRRERAKQIELAKARGEAHIGVDQKKKRASV